jgi:structural maintenance of chromosome 2
LTKLRDERSTYLEYQKIQRELEHLTRLHIAFKFVSVEELAQKSRDDLAAEEQRMETYHKEIADGEEQVKAIQAHVRELQRQRDEELGGRLEELESRLSAKEKSAAKAETALKTSKDNKKQEEKKRVQIEKGMNTVSFLFHRMTFTQILLIPLQISKFRIRKPITRRLRCPRACKPYMTSFARSIATARRP